MAKRTSLPYARKFFLTLALAALPVAAQTGLGVVRGTVQDASKAVIPGAKVTLTNTATGVGRDSTTNADGIYYFGAVSIGPYTLLVESQGFKINPFSLPPTKENLDFLALFLKVLIQGQRAGELDPATERDLFHQVENLYAVDPALRTLGVLANTLGHDIASRLSKWTRDGQFGFLFDNSEDTRYLIMLHEQVVRADVTPVEEGVLFLQLAEKHQWSMDDLLRVFKRSENYINDRVELVQKDTKVAEAVQRGDINLGQAKQVLRPKDPSFRLYLLDQAATHGANARTLQQMIVNKEQEERSAQGELKLHTPELATAPEAPPAMVCIWCRSGDNPEHMRVVQVHWFHQKDLEAVCEQLGVHNLHKAVAGEGRTV